MAKPKQAWEDHPNFRKTGTNGQFKKEHVTEFASVTPQGSAEDPHRDADRAGALLPFVQLGRTGLRHFSGIIDEEFLPQLRGPRALTVFREMKDNDPTVGATLFAVEMLMRQVAWRTEAADDSPAALEQAEFVESCFGDMADTWPDTLASIFSFLPFGHSVHEQVFKLRAGHNPDDLSRDSKFNDRKIGWRKFAGRSQDTITRWIIPPGTDELAGIVQLPPPDFRERVIPMSKLLLFRTTTAKGNPLGRSILRNAYRPWFFKKRIEEIEGIGIERDLAGLPTMGVPAKILTASASDDEKALLVEIRKMLSEVRRDEREGVIFPIEFDADGHDMYKFELMRSGGRRQFDTTQIVTRYDRRIAGVVLADFILLGGERVGSFALADSKTELFGLALGAWLDVVVAIFNRKAIPDLMAINGMASELSPKLVHGDVESIDLAALGTYIAALSSAGMLTANPETENALRAHATLPEIDVNAEPEPDPEPLPRPFPPGREPDPELDLEDDPARPDGSGG